MESLKIPQGQAGISKTLRLPADIVEDIEALSSLKKTSLNQVTIILLKFALQNLDDKERAILEQYKKEIKKENKNQKKSL